PTRRSSDLYQVRALCKYRSQSHGYGFTTRQGANGAADIKCSNKWLGSFLHIPVIANDSEELFAVVTSFNGFNGGEDLTDTKNIRDGRICLQSQILWQVANPARGFNMASGR